MATGKPRVLPAKPLYRIKCRSGIGFFITAAALALTGGCQSESKYAEQVSIDTVPGADHAPGQVYRIPFSPSAPLKLGFDHDADLFTESGLLLFRRTQLYYSAEQGHSQPGSLLVQNRGDTWHGPFLRLPPLAPGKVFRLTVWIKLAEDEPSTAASLMVTRTADGENRTLTLAEADLRPDGWIQLEGEFISVNQVADDIVTAHVEVESRTAKYFMDDISIAYSDGSGDPVMWAAGDEKSAPTEFIRNGSAEEGLEPWGRQGGAISHSAERAHTGEYSVLITNRTQVWHAPTMDVSGLQNNIAYEFSIFVYIEDGQPPADMKLTLKRVTDGQTSYVTLATREAVESGAWVEVAGRFVAANASRSQAVTVYLESSDPEMSYYVDTLTVTEVR